MVEPVMDGETAETFAGVVRLLRRASELAWVRADREGPRSPLSNPTTVASMPRPSGTSSHARDSSLRRRRHAAGHVPCDPGRSRARSGVAAVTDRRPTCRRNAPSRLRAAGNITAVSTTLKERI